MNRKTWGCRKLLGLLLALLLALPAWTMPAAADSWVSWDWGDALEGWEFSDEEADEAEQSAAPEKDDDRDEEAPEEEDIPDVEEDGEYTSKEEVAAYLYLFGHLPDNYITKGKAKKLGWVSSEGNLNKVAPGKSIGGDHFGNYEQQLPEKKGREYFECDIDYTGGRRNAKRIIFSNDGLIYYTEDHYNTFELLYGEE